jgi:hypothetical protein
MDLSLIGSKTSPFGYRERILLQMIGTKHTTTAAYHPQANAQVERLNRTILNFSEEPFRRTPPTGKLSSPPSNSTIILCSILPSKWLHFNFFMAWMLITKGKNLRLTNKDKTS